MATEQLSRKNSVVELFTDTIIALCEEYHTISGVISDAKANVKSFAVLDTKKETQTLQQSEQEDIKIDDVKEGNSNYDGENDTNVWGSFRNRQHFIDMHCG